ncbi:hypothetical protein GQ53DRAFT_741020 [Thozetella sp. PMI_491]|nr:hypothetical protein GQ53DRAFT_741020 [Thozetella sp. PMI_491]
MHNGAERGLHSTIRGARHGALSLPTIVTLGSCSRQGPLRFRPVRQCNASDGRRIILPVSKFQFGEQARDLAVASSTNAEGEKGRHVCSCTSPPALISV